MSGPVAMFGQASAPAFPVRRGRGLFGAALLHAVLLAPLLMSATHYEPHRAAPPEAVGVTFVMAPLRGAGNPPLAARPDPERKEQPIERPKVASSRIPSQPPPLPADSLAPLVPPLTLTVPDPLSPNVPAETGATASPVAAEPAESSGSEGDGHADGPLRPAIGTLSGESNWAGLVLGRLEQFRRYPAMARARRQEGVSYVRFTIDRQGRVLSLTLERSSGHTLLDREAVALVRRADPLPPPPELEGDTVTLTVPVQFFLTR